MTIAFTTVCSMKFYQSNSNKFFMQTVMQERKGYRSPKNGHLGVYTLCSGPDPNGPAPGERLIIVVYDKDNNIVRKLEQVRGSCLEQGYVDFFNSHRCRPSVHEYHMIDTDKDGKMEIVATHTDPRSANSWLQVYVPNWVKQHGIPQE